MEIYCTKILVLSGGGGGGVVVGEISDNKCDIYGLFRYMRPQAKILVQKPRQVIKASCPKHKT